MKTQEEVRRLLNRIKEDTGTSKELRGEVGNLLNEVQAGEVEHEAIYSAIHVFGESGYNKAMPLVEKSLADDDAEVRKIALNVLGVHWDSKEHSEVYQRFLEDRSEDESVRAMAASCLGYTFRETKSKEVLDMLLRMSEDDSEPDVLRSSSRDAMLDVWGLTLPQRMRARLQGSSSRSELSAVQDIKKYLSVAD